MIKPAHHRIRTLDQIRREQRGEGGDGDGDGIKKIAGDVQREPELRDDERELANLRQPHADAQGSAAVIARDERAEGTHQHLAHDHGDGDDQDRHPILEEHRGLNHQADGHEEDCAEHVADRFHQVLDLPDLARLGDDRANDEGAEGHAVFELYGEQREAEAQPEDHDEEHFLAFEFRHVTQQARHRQQPHDQRHDEEDDKPQHGAHDLAGLQRAARRDAREQGNHHDGEDVLDDEDAEDELREMLLGFAEFAERLDDDRG